MKLPLLVIAGPTGVGKTAVAVALAARIPLEVVSADSRQVYRFMDVATGKPTAAERAAARHHLIDVVDPDDRYHAARFRHDAIAAIADIHRRGHRALHPRVAPRPRSGAARGSRAARGAHDRGGARGPRGAARAPRRERAGGGAAPASE